MKSSNITEIADIFFRRCVMLNAIESDYFLRRDCVGGICFG